MTSMVDGVLSANSRRVTTGVKNVVAQDGIESHQRVPVQRSRSR